MLQCLIDAKRQPQTSPVRNRVILYTICLKDKLRCRRGVVDREGLPRKQRQSGTLYHLVQPFDSDESSALLNRLTDEFDYWKRYEMNAASPGMKKKASYYNNVYKDIEEAWRRISELPVNGLMKEVVEPTLGCLDQVWINDYNYPGNRFYKLVTLFTSSLWMRLGQHLPRIEPGCKARLAEIDDLFSYWVSTLKEYKEKIWDK